MSTKIRCEVRVFGRWREATVDLDGERVEVSKAKAQRLAKEMNLPERPPGEYVYAHTREFGFRVVHVSFVRKRRVVKGKRKWVYPLEG